MTNLDNHDAFSKMSEPQILEWVFEALEPPSDFGYGGDNEQMFVTWSLGPVIEHRDSGLAQKSNAKTIVKILENDPSLEGEWELVSCNHWAVGWVEHLSFRVVDKDGKPSRVARVIKGLFDSMEEYPILDDEDHSRMEYEATMENIENHYGRGKLHDNVPEDWALQMFSWFWNNDQGAVENCDGQGGYPSDEQFETCARDLEFWDTSEDEDDE